MRIGIRSPSRALPDALINAARGEDPSAPPKKQKKGSGHPCQPKSARPLQSPLKRISRVERGLSPPALEDNILTLAEVLSSLMAKLGAANEELAAFDSDIKWRLERILRGSQTNIPGSNRP